MKHAICLAILAALAGGLVSSGGCMRAIGEGAEKTLGPKGDYFEESPLAPSKTEKALAGYTELKLGKLTNEFPRNTPPEFARLFALEFEKQANEAGLGGMTAGKTLLANVAIIHYEHADMADNILGPLEQVVARVELVDADSGAVLGAGNVIGRTGKSVGLGVDWKARGLAKGIIKWVKDYSPKKGKAES
jgi:hypothetical protein